MEHNGRKGRLVRGHSPGITSAQHPVRRRPKAVHDSYLPAIIRTASPNLHIEPRRRSDRVREQGALSLSRHQAPVAQWIEQAPSKRLAAGSSPAGGAHPQPSPREGFSLVRTGADRYDEAPVGPLVIKGGLRGHVAVTGFRGRPWRKRVEDRGRWKIGRRPAARSPATFSRRFGRHPPTDTPGAGRQVRGRRRQVTSRPSTTPDGRSGLGRVSEPPPDRPRMNGPCPTSRASSSAWPLARILSRA